MGGIFPIARSSFLTSYRLLFGHCLLEATLFTNSWLTGHWAIWIGPWGGSILIKAKVIIPWFNSYWI